MVRGARAGGGVLRLWASEKSRDPRPHPVLRTVFRVATAVELFFATLWSMRRRVGPANPGNVTLVIKTFERPKVLRRMLRSVRKVYSGPIIVADDSREPFVSTDPGVHVLRMPFNSGLSRGRNAAFDLVTTPYIWLADDDMILLRDFDIARITTYLEEHSEVDLVGGKVINLPQVEPSDSLKRELYSYAGEPRQRLGTVIGGLPVTYLTPNWYVARTEKLQELRYDDELRLVEHTDFFTRAYGVLLCVLDNEMIGLHSHSYFDPEYQAFRGDTSAAFARISQKWGVREGEMETKVEDLLGADKPEFHHAALQIVASDMGIPMLHDYSAGSMSARVLLAPVNVDALTGVLSGLGWDISGTRVRHPMWGEGQIVGADEFDEQYRESCATSVASVPVQARAENPHATGAPRAVVPTSPSGISWSTRAAWLTGEVETIAAALPIGPTYALSFPSNVIWEEIGPLGKELDQVVSDTLVQFPDAPEDAENQIIAFIELLVSRGLLIRR